MIFLIYQAASRLNSKTFILGRIAPFLGELLVERQNNKQMSEANTQNQQLR